MCRLTIAQQELVMYTEKMTRQTQQITDYEYEITLLRKQLESLETEREKDRNKITELEELLAKAREVFAGVDLSVHVFYYRRSSVIGRSVGQSVCLSVGHVREPCKNG